MDEITTIVTRPFIEFMYPDTRLYWLFMLISLLIAIGVIMITARSAGLSPQVALKQQLSAKIWWNASARADYKYYLLNGILYGLAFAPFVLASAEVGIWVENLAADIFGPQDEPMFSALAFRIAYTICFFIAFDFGQFLSHWVQHQSNFLWQFHKVHHSAECLNPLTAFRGHPVDLLLVGSGGNLFGGIMTGIFFYISAGQVTIYTFLGTQLLVAVFNMIGNLRHTHVWLDYGRLGYIFISPAQHQIHHSALPRHFNKNCGFALAIWDWIFGTLYVPKNRETFPMGLTTEPDPTWHTMTQFYWRPINLAYNLVKDGVTKYRNKQP